MAAAAFSAAAILGASCTFPEVTIVPECAEDAECADDGDPCVVVRCVQETCVTEPRTPDLCPTVANPCQTSGCAEGVCATVAVEDRQSCPNDGLCVGGACVECQIAGDCTADYGAGAQCVEGFCAKEHCTNDTHDDDLEETDVDCGGPCPPCGESSGCLSSRDCGDLGCVDNICGPCVSEADCDGGFCCRPDEGCGEPGRCVPTFSDGVACASDTQCDNGNCEDGVCCEERCEGQCMACSEARTGLPDGVCAPTLCNLTEPGCGPGAIILDSKKCLGNGTCGSALAGCQD